MALAGRPEFSLPETEMPRLAPFILVPAAEVVMIDFSTLPTATIRNQVGEKQVRDL